MATVNIFAQGDSGETVYFLFMRESDRYVLDYDDNTFKANAAACTDFKWPATENTDAGDADESTYFLALDGSYLNSAATKVPVQVTAFYDKATDEIFSNGQIVIVSSDELHLTPAQVNTEADTALSDAGYTSARAAALTDWLDGGRLDLLLDAIKAVTDVLPDSGALTTIAADTARLTAARAGALTDLIDGGRLDLLIDAIKAVTDVLPDAGALSSIATAANLTTVAEYLDTEIAAIVAAVITNAAGADIAADIIALKVVADWLKDVAEGDVTIDTSGSPYELVIEVKDTATERIRKKLYTLAGVAIGADADIVGQQLESAP
jgi:hypothetical protein